MGARENPVTKACQEILDILGVPNMRNSTGMARGATRPISFGKPGWPDILGVLPDGRFLGVETKAPEIRGLYRKRPAGKLSDLQKAVHKQLRASKALVITATSGTEMHEALQREGYFT